MDYVCEAAQKINYNYGKNIQVYIIYVYLKNHVQHIQSEMVFTSCSWHGKTQITPNYIPLIMKKMID